MEILSVMRMLGALGVVLGLLVGALWAVRRFNIRLPGAVGGGGGPLRRLELVERVSMDPRRSVALIRRDGREHLVLLAPEGNTVIETGILMDQVDIEASEARQAAVDAAAAEAAERAERAREEFKAMVDRTAERLGEVRAGAGKRLAGVRDGARKAAARTRDAADKARQAAERRRSGLAAIGDPAAEPVADVEAAPTAPVEPVAARPAPESILAPQAGLFAGLVEEAKAGPKPRVRRSRKAAKPADKTDGQ